MPQLDPSTYASQIFWLLICFFALMFIMSTFIIPKIADTKQQRDNKIDSYVMKAEELQQKTESAIKKYEDALSEATRQANNALKSTKDELNDIISRRQADLDKKLQAQLKAGEAEINAGKNEALKEIKNISANMALEILRKLDIAHIKMSDIKPVVEQEAKQQ